jgi:hypothetical protein
MPDEVAKTPMSMLEIVIGKGTFISEKDGTQAYTNLA